MVTVILLSTYLIIVCQYPTEPLDVFLGDVATEIRCDIWVNVEGGLVVLLPLDLKGGQLRVNAAGVGQPSICIAHSGFVGLNKPINCTLVYLQAGQTRQKIIAHEAHKDPVIDGTF